VACSKRSCLLQVGQLQRQLHILKRGQHRNQIELLKDEAHMFIAPVRDLAVAQLAQIVAQHADLARQWLYPWRRSGAAAWTCPSPRAPSAPRTRPCIDLNVDVLERHNVELVADILFGQIDAFQ
jgi:hypothetical protein